MPDMGTSMGHESAPGNDIHSRGTRDHMIDVAERLFAEYGVEAVSLRMVGTEAGQRNNSAAQYHFGSKQGLIEAIIATRSPAVEARRQELVDEYARNAAAADPAALVRLLVVPLAETIDRSRRRIWYLRFLANVIDHPMWEHITEPSKTEQPGLHYMGRQLRQLLPRLSPATFRRRNRWIAIIAFRILADHEYRVATADHAPSTETVVEELVTGLVGLLTAAPVPPDSESGPGRHAG